MPHPRPTPAEARAYLDALLQQSARSESLAAENIVLRERVRALEAENARLRSGPAPAPRFPTPPDQSGS